MTRPAARPPEPAISPAQRRFLGGCAGLLLAAAALVWASPAGPALIAAPVTALGTALALVALRPGD